MRQAILIILLILLTLPSEGATLVILERSSNLGFHATLADYLAENLQPDDEIIFTHIDTSVSR